MAGKPEDSLLFSIAGARGIVGKGLDVDVVTRLTLAFCATLVPGPIVIGRDTRPSGLSLQYAAMAAIMAAGRECIDLGVATTPTVGMMVEKLGASGGIVVTASHNPSDWNALKFLDRRGIFIPKAMNEKLYEIYSSGRFEFSDAASTGELSSYDRAARDHIDAIVGLHVINVDQIRKRAFRVVLDCINGAASVVARDLLEALGVRAVPMNCKTDGNFYRNPEPRPENLGDVSERVKREVADVGFAIDPDGDRVAMIDETGKALSEELTLGVAAHYVLETEKKGPIVVNVSTSALIDWIASRYRASVVRTPVGEAHVVEAMLQSHAPIGGEGNGGVIYPELHPGRDAMVATALILQFLAERETSLSELVKTYPPFFMTKEKVPLHGEFSKERISRLIDGLQPARIDTTDGVKAIFDDGWFHIRVSNTEGVVRVIAEAMTKERVSALQTSARRVLEAALGG